MPADFLSDGEWSRYQAIPPDLSLKDLNQFCFLSPTDGYPVQLVQYFRVNF